MDRDDRRWIFQSDMPRCLLFSLPRARKLNTCTGHIECCHIYFTSLGRLIFPCTNGQRVSLLPRPLVKLHHRRILPK